MDAAIKPQHDGFHTPFFETTLVRAFVVYAKVTLRELNKKATQYAKEHLFKNPYALSSPALRC